MSDKFIKEFIEQQLKLINPISHSKPPSKDLIKPEQREKVTSENDLESEFNHIIEKKPAPKKVIKFLQNAIDEIIANSED